MNGVAALARDRVALRVLDLALALDHQGAIREHFNRHRHSGLLFAWWMMDRRSQSILHDMTTMPDPVLPAPFVSRFAGLQELAYTGPGTRFHECFGCGPNHDIGLRVRTFRGDGGVASP